MMRVWFKGGLVADGLTLSPLDRGLTLGDGLFETLLVHNGVALWHNEHLARFKNSAAELGMAFPEQEIAASVAALCKEATKHHVLRLTLTRGASGRGLASETDDFSYFATLQPFDPGLMFQPVDLTLVSVCRNETSPASRLKVTSYMDQILAAREAAARKCDDALMLNTKGNVACSTIGNVFLIKGNHLITPALDQGILPGIMRAVVLGLAESEGFIVEERAVAATELDKSGGVFTTNSLRFLRPAKGYAGSRHEPLIERLCAAAKMQSGADLRAI